MSIPSTRNAYLKGMLTRGEATVSLRNHPDDDELIDALIQEWDLIVAYGVRLDQPLTSPEPGVYFCTRCGQLREPKDLSRRGVCIECQDRIAWRVQRELVARSGHYYRVWRNGMLRAAYRLEDESIAQHLTLGDLVPTE